jgi:hypothetical protein
VACLYKKHPAAAHQPKRYPWAWKREVSGVELAFRGPVCIQRLNLRADHSSNNTTMKIDVKQTVIMFTSSRRTFWGSWTIWSPAFVKLLSLSPIQRESVIRLARGTEFTYPGGDVHCNSAKTSGQRPAGQTRRAYGDAATLGAPRPPWQTNCAAAMVPSPCSAGLVLDNRLHRTLVVDPMPARYGKVFTSRVGHRCLATRAHFLTPICTGGTQI